jgi:hypothetical protein
MHARCSPALLLEEEMLIRRSGESTAPSGERLPEGAFFAPTPSAAFERRAPWWCLILLVKAIRVRVRSLAIVSCARPGSLSDESV